MAPSEAPKAKKISAYFSFCKHHREQAKARLLQAGQSVSAPALTKALSELWRSLSDEEKQKYKDPTYVSAVIPPSSSGHGDPENAASEAGRSQDQSEKSHVGGSADRDGNTEDVAMDEDEKECGADANAYADGAGVCREGVQNVRQSGDPAENGGLVLPLARVKRIVKLDREIRVVASDATNLIVHAAQLFLEHLAMSAHAAAAGKKHKTIRIEDVMNAVRSESRVDEFLAEALDEILHNDEEDDSYSSDDVDDAAENAHDANHSNKKQKVAKKSFLKPVTGTKNIAEFFSASNHSEVRE